MKTQLPYTRGQQLTETVFGYFNEPEDHITNVIFLDQDDDCILIFLSEEDGGITPQEKYINLTIKDVQDGNYDYNDVMIEEGLVILDKIDDGTIETCLGFEIKLTTI